MRLLSVLSMILITGCATPPLSMKPVDAQVPELKFSYYKNGLFKSAYGHAGNHFKEGEPKIFKVKVNKFGGSCKLRYIDGNDDVTKDCTGMSEVTLDMGWNFCISRKIRYSTRLFLQFDEKRA